MVFFLHGCPDTRHAAYPGAEAATDAGVRLIAVNRPGYGLSDPCDSDHLTVADDVAAVADQLGIERYAVLGMSLGGPYALACAVRHPGRVTAVALVESPAIPFELDPPYHRDDLGPDQQKFFTDLAHGTVDEAIEALRPGFEKYRASLALDDPDDEALAARWIKGHPPLDAAYLAHLPPSAVAASVREALANPAGYLRDAAITFRTWSFRPEAVICPVTVHHGVEDPNPSIRNAHWLAAHIPGATATFHPTAHLTTLHEHWPQFLDELTGRS
ncbi:pimeloyl-ACP methyl ester carboxylesterase [Kribbella amoyensis]|uniref:Pimeloyl-ACP methyl ester carboxylesterase n=1 Tax=Kribbella amoyensis TaxID=996641 RepID=A0A561BMB0_9ACTN|nr:alpha/beta hydrolase [Kribbella amoyensis]TWD79995.1 pimeloyl-ACP methyl ester carboxylesterase [Kribbella amoyensis]